MPSCDLADATTRELTCRNSIAATHVKKLGSILVIFLTIVLGISSPVCLAKSFQGKPVYDKAILVIKCFAAGVILSTLLVHVLPDAFNSFSDCSVSTRHPWKDFSFSGLVTLIGALLALLVDLTVNSSHVHMDEKKVMAYRVIEKDEVMVTVSGDVDVKDDTEIELEAEKVRQRRVSQVLEIGIIFHSVIVGVTMGMSHNVGYLSSAFYYLSSILYTTFTYLSFLNPNLI